MVHVNKLLVGSLLWAFHHQSSHAFSPICKSVRGVPNVSANKNKYHSRFQATIEENAMEVSGADDELEPEHSGILGAPIPYQDLTIGIMKETYKGENRVSQSPDSVKMLVKEGFNVVVQAGGKYVHQYWL